MACIKSRQCSVPPEGEAQFWLTETLLHGRIIYMRLINQRTQSSVVSCLTSTFRAILPLQVSS